MVTVVVAVMVDNGGSCDGCCGGTVLGRGNGGGGGSGKGEGGGEGKGGGKGTTSQKCRATHPVVCRLQKWSKFF